MYRNLAGLLAAAILMMAGSAQAAEHWHNYPGAVHIHTVYSDGSGTVEEVVEAAGQTDVRFIIITDHNTLEPLADGHERYWDDLLVLVGTEISTDVGHVLALDIPADFDLEDRAAQSVMDRIHAARGIGILAHPMSPRWLWEDWSVKGYGGIEIINLASIIDDDIRTAAHGQATSPAAARRLAQLSKRYLADPDATLRRITNNTLDTEREKWDELLGRGQRVVGIGSVDAHARVPVGSQVFKVPTYQEAFESVQTYVVTSDELTGELGRDRKLVYDSFRKGSVYAVYPRMSSAGGFRFTATEGARTVTMGDTITVDERVRLVVEAPDHPRPLIRLLRDGTEITSSDKKRLEWTVTTPGAYRVEVYVRASTGPLIDIRRGLRLPSVEELLKGRELDIRPWIFSNPIYVRG